MGDIVLNVAKGRIRTFAELGAASDALILVLLKASGLVADSVMKDYDTLADITGGASDEADFTGYARRTLANVSVTVDDTGDIVNIDCDDPAAWTNSGTVQAIGAALICYDDNTGSGTDANIVPIGKWDCVLTFDVGVATSVTMPALGPLYAG